MKRIFYVIVAAATVMMLNIFSGTAHSLVRSQPMPHKATVECQSMCPPVLTENKKTPQFEEDEADPDPLPLIYKIPNLGLATIYAVLMSSLALLFLQRRPPDLIILQAAYRL